jgi:hypothetical protein
VSGARRPLHLNDPHDAPDVRGQPVTHPRTSAMPPATPNESQNGEEAFTYRRQLDLKPPRLATATPNLPATIAVHEEVVWDRSGQTNWVVNDAANAAVARGGSCLLFRHGC